MQKKTLRKEMLKKRDKLKDREARSSTIEKKLLELVEREDIKSVFIFMSFGSEVETKEVIKVLLKNGIKVSLPKINELKMLAVEIESLEELVEGKMGILEPTSKNISKDIDLVVVPGVIFDKFGYRIGYGGGYYDRFLENLDKNIIKVGISFEVQVVEKIERETWDIRIDQLITEESTYYFKRIEEYGVKIGRLPRGRRNLITDVEGIKVGHCTISHNNINTGLTLISPREDIWKNKLIGASHIINGYGKSIGLMQIDELGQIETPIALTNTLCAGRVADYVVGHMLERDPIVSVNPVVGECNDSYLNNIVDRVIDEKHFKKAVEDLNEEFLEGAVGAGRGVSCHKLKGGIGSSSRLVNIGKREYKIGVLVQSNYGLLEDLTIDGINIGEKIGSLSKREGVEEVDKGSIMMVVATDIPLESRQLKRIAKRASNGLAKLGSFTSHGSGEVVIAFSTGNIISKEDVDTVEVIREELLDSCFKGVGEAVEEAVLNSMVRASEVCGSRGKRESLARYMYLLKRERRMKN